MHTSFSDNISEITKALINFQKLCPKITKSKSSMYGMYADLANILETIRPALIECELAVVQMPDGKNGLTTLVSHSSGQWIRSFYEMEPLPVVVDKTTKERAVTPQSLGSVITYQRRYALGAALGFAAEEDTDARLKKEKLAEKPKKSVADLLKQQSAEATSKDAQPATEGVSLSGVTSIATTSLCTAEDVATIKQMVADWDATKPGAAAEFTKRIAATGRKLAQFTIAEADALKQAIQIKSIESFFDHQLQKAS